MSQARTEENAVIEQPGADYLAWNDALASHFFSPEAAGTSVYLFVTDEVLTEVGRSLGGGRDEFIEAIRTGPSGATRPNHCQRALQIATGWRAGAFKVPPYLAYLGLFVLAGGHEGEFDPRSYYPRLWELLGEPGAGAPPSFERMWELWEDLESWTVRDRQGNLGIFEARPLGGKIHIGLPLAQTVLTEAERRALPTIFVQAGLDVGTLPSHRELRRALLQGRALLRRQTARSLESGPGSFSEALIDVVSDEFINWDGEVPLTSPGNSSQSLRELSAGLRLCLSVDKVSRQARATLRCRSRRDLPDDGLLLTSSMITQSLTCTEFLPGWSHALATSPAGGEFAPPTSVWSHGMTLSSASPRWTVRLRPAHIRAFVEGHSQQLPGLVEVRELSRGIPFYLAFPEALWPKLEPWIAADCDHWTQLELTGGLPAGWMFGSIRDARTDTGIRAVDDGLGFPDRRVLRVVGGVRAGVGIGFFDFAPPHLVLDGFVPGDTVFCGDSELNEDPANPHTYLLPAGLAPDKRIGLEVRNGEDIIVRRSLYLLSGFPWRLDSPVATFDQYGRPQATVEPEGIAGATVRASEHEPFVSDLLRTPGLGPPVSRIYFIGKAPGEIAAWPKDSLPEWPAIWAIPFGRRGRAVYCGDSVNAAAPSARRRPERARMKLWHHVLWQSRRKITPPKERTLKALWREYREVARGA